MARNVIGYVPRIGESEEAYVERMRATVLPNFPANVLTHWLYKHREHALYSELSYDTLVFEDEPQTWATEEIPVENCGAYEAIEGYSRWYEANAGKWECDPLCEYMGQHGTWPQPIILIDNRGGVVKKARAGTKVGRPYHPLEGHRRLGFFLALKSLCALQPTHRVWLVTKRKE
jgi:hypothetical protein